MVSPTYVILFYSVLYHIFYLLYCLLYAVYLGNYAVLVFSHNVSNGLLFLLYALNRKALKILKKGSA